ncbi:hypothetical protein [Oceanobacillus sp. Castelsardo]|uniref:hypothetical protein n=1 Tax=Oceanobacillus sp. Castelsardo TaxID=1851204 RepID=UPI0008393A6A|nr:hypothetical protein [Oceanobacillus sp. Castelsardo]
MMEVKTQEIFFTEEKVIRTLGKKEVDTDFSIRNIVYYPYMFYEFSFKRGNPITPLKGDVACTIDAISGIPALVDKRPEFTTLKIANKNILPIQLEENQTVELAKEFLYRTISKNIKVATAPNISLKQCHLFYRPYWIIDGKANEHGFTLMVDSISGKYHPLNVE